MRSVCLGISAFWGQLPSVFVNVETSASLLTDDGGADDGGVDGRVGRLNLPVAGPVGATQRSELLRLYSAATRGGSGRS